MSRQDTPTTRPLSLEEKEQLTATINELPPHALPRVIQIIREAAAARRLSDQKGGEIDLEIEQLDKMTQWKLLEYVNQFTTTSSR